MVRGGPGRAEKVACSENNKAMGRWEAVLGGGRGLGLELLSHQVIKVGIREDENYPGLKHPTCSV